MKMENVEDVYRLSSAQKGMLFHTISQPKGGAYVDQYSCTLAGRLDAEAIKTSWELLVQRQPVLRTAFLWEGLDEPLQVVRQKVHVPWEYLDWRDQAREVQQTNWDRYLEKNRVAGFELSHAPLLRLTLIRIADERYRFLWAFHHLLSDGWSTSLLLNEVFDTYNTLAQGNRINDGPPPLFRDFIAYLKQCDLSQAEAFWRNALKGFSAPTSLRRVGSLGASADSAGTFGRQEIELDSQTTEALSSMARQGRFTLNTVVQGVWGLLLSRYSGESDVVFGATVSGRPAGLPGVEQMAGLFINTLPVRVRVAPTDTVIPWLKGLHGYLIEMQKYENSPLVQVQGWSEVPRGQALFESIVVFENYPAQERQTQLAGGIEICDTYYTAHSNYPLAFLAMPGRRMKLMLIHDHGYLDNAAATRVLGHVASLLSAMATDSTQRVADLTILTPEERDSIASNCHWDQHSPPPPKCLHELFEAQVDQTPDAPAVIGEGQQLTYRQLEQRANQLAHYLRNKGVGADAARFVGVCVDRSPQLLVALLGVLKAGGAYVPLDPDYPPVRLANMMEDAGVSILLTQEALADRIPTHSAKTILLDTDWDEISTAHAGRISGAVAADDLAYVIFTSGSTGKPAGVMVTHRNAAYSTTARLEYYDATPDRFLMLSSYAFDSSVAGLFWPISSGGAVCLPERGRHIDTAYLVGFIQRHGVSHVLCVPSFYNELLHAEHEALAGLKVVIVAGEACKSDLVRFHHERLVGTRLYNEYGPTEATVWCIVHPCHADDADEAIIPIGRPIPHAKIYVLDPAMKPVPIGVPGDLYIGGPGVTNGYINRPELTGQRYMPNPFEPDGDGRLYRTGDLARCREDGNLEFLGRTDHQVKVRGYRIELGEIEAALADHPAINEAIVMVEDTHRPDQPALNAETSHTETDPSRDTQAADPLQGGGESQKPAARWTRKSDHYELLINLKNEGFINPPAGPQRAWLVNQLVNECADDLKHLHEQAKRFVPGTQSGLGQREFSQEGLDANQIMEDWQTPIMKAMAEIATESHGDVLEIGFGRGVSAGIIQDMGVRSHTLIEASDTCISNFFEPWRERLADRDIRLVRGKWQDVLDQLGQYDSVFFHAVPLDEDEFIEDMVNSVTFAEHVFPVAASVLSPGGVFTYLTTEIDSFSRRHQRLVFKHFKSLSLSVQPLAIPDDTKDMWWADSMVIVKAIK